MAPIARKGAAVRQQQCDAQCALARCANANPCTALTSSTVAIATPTFRARRLSLLLPCLLPLLLRSLRGRLNGHSCCKARSHQLQVLGRQIRRASRRRSRRRRCARRHSGHRRGASGSCGHGIADRECARVYQDPVHHLSKAVRIPRILSKHLRFHPAHLCGLPEGRCGMHTNEPRHEA